MDGHGQGSSASRYEAPLSAHLEGLAVEGIQTGLGIPNTTLSHHLAFSAGRIQYSHTTEKMTEYGYEDRLNARRVQVGRKRFHTLPQLSCGLRFLSEARFIRSIRSLSFSRCCRSVSSLGSAWGFVTRHVMRPDSGDSG